MDRVAKARAALAESIEKEKLRSEQRKNVLFQNQIKSLREENKELKELTEKQEKVAGVDARAYKNKIIQDLSDHFIGNEADFTNETYNLALQIKAISPKAYALLSKNLGFPSVSLVDAKFREAISGIPEKLTDVEKIGELINMWKEKHRISKSLVIEACLAVDALYFKPDFKITEDDCISGMAFTNELKSSLPNGSFSHFDQTPSALQAFLELNWDKIIKAGFVFQIQPYSVKYKPFVVHIMPSANGKATEEVINLLDKIREISMKRRIVVKSYAFDGDNAYKQLHLMYFESYIKKVIETNKISETNTHALRVVSDYLHLLKRLRYRLLSSILHAGFSEESDKIIVEELLSLLDGMGEAVWCNEKFTKMHDKLPLELFKTENLLKLIENKQFVAAAYWFPITLSNIALNQEDIGFEYRDFLLKCAFYFLVYYYDCFEMKNSIRIVPNHQEGVKVKARFSHGSLTI